NSGPGCSTVNDPPAIYEAAFSTGAIDITNTIASFSSRGPVTRDGSNRLKPNLSAPGVNVRSSYSTSDTTYANLSGTSMAGPPTRTATAPPTPTSTPTSSPTPTPCVGQYVINQIGGSIVPGTTDIGNHGDDTVVTIALPFPFTLYDQSFTSINLSSNGNAQFTTTDK